MGNTVHGKTHGKPYNTRKTHLAHNFFSMCVPAEHRACTHSFFKQFFAVDTYVCVCVYTCMCVGGFIYTNIWWGYNS